jgi:hypothetical protein
MAKQTGKRSKKPGYDETWAKAKRLCRLNVEDVRMAKEMGLNPRSLLKNIPGPSQRWKAPVRNWIRDMYEDRQEKVERKRRCKAAAATQPQETTPPKTEPGPSDGRRP